MQDQIEIFTKEKTETTHLLDVQKVLDELPVREQQERNALMDSIAAEEEESKRSHAFRDLETILSWIAYAAAMGVAVALTWAVAIEVSHYL